MATVRIDFVGDKEFQRDLQALARDAPKRWRAAVDNIGIRVVKRSKEYCPISPTLNQLSARLTRGLRINEGGKRRGASTGIRINPNTGTISITRTAKRAIRTGRNRPTPGTLMNSIRIMSKGSNTLGAWVSIGVPVNSRAGAYAAYIHDGGPNGTQDWLNRGLGTRAKGPQATDKFIERGIKDEEKNFGPILNKHVRAWLRHNSGLT